MNAVNLLAAQVLHLDQVDQVADACSSWTIAVEAVVHAAHLLELHDSKQRMPVLTAQDLQAAVKCHICLQSSLL